MDSEQIKIFLAVFIGGLIVLYIILKILQRIGKFFINVKLLREKKSKIDNSNELPEWFDGEVYEEGDDVLNPFTGEKVKLTANELSMYDFIQGCSMLSPNLLNDSIIKNRQKGLNWFKTVNPKAYMVLFG